MKLIDLKGKKVGKWTVIDIDRTNKSKHIKWICLCECGLSKSFSLRYIKKGLINACRCDLVGKKINRWTILRQAIKQECKYSGKWYLCKCECGKEVFKTIPGLRCSQSCGCYFKEIKAKQRLNLLYQKFGRLTVISQGVKKYHWICQCECGIVKSIYFGSLISGDTKSCGCLQKYMRENGLIRQPERKIGEEHSNWKGFGGISGQYFGTLKQGAKKRNISFDISIQDIHNQFEKQKGLCNLTGKELVLKKSYKQEIQIQEHTASIDRIDSSKGYTPDNIQWVDKDVNKMKNDLSQNQFIYYCRLITEYQASKLNKKLDFL